MKRARMDEKFRLDPDDLVDGVTPAELESKLIEEVAKGMGLEQSNWAHDGSRWWYWTGDAWVRVWEETEH